MWQVVQLFVAFGQAFAACCASAVCAEEVRWQLKQVESYDAASVLTSLCGSWHAAHPTLASPVPQHLLDSSRYGCMRTFAMPRTPDSFTSRHVPWHAPQKSTASAGPSRPGLKMNSPFVDEIPAAAFACIASTCLAPGPWQASHAIPGTIFASSKRFAMMARVEWQAKQRRTSPFGTRRSIASVRVCDGEIWRAGVTSSFCAAVKYETRAS